MLEERARANGLTLSEWVRDVLLSAPEPGAEAGEVVLAEVLALRTLFLNLQFRQGLAPLSEAEMRGLIERADGDEDAAGAGAAGCGAARIREGGSRNRGAKAMSGAAKWPSRYPAWTLGALGVAALLFCAQVWVQYAREWSEAERMYLADYLRSGIRGACGQVRTGGMCC